LSANAPARTDLFTAPDGSARYDNAPRVHGILPDDDFALSARVDVDFAGSYDAGVLLLWASPTTWAKLCFEFSPQRQPMVVSVITRDVSDDANAFDVTGSSTWLRVSRMNGAYSYHASVDGQTWSFVRHFALESAEPMQLGFLVQSPVGEGCAVRFSEITYGTTTYADLRDGS
ncbi:MAG: DUF1349 domain-containing protein, partial [Mycobacteriales bacterium]